MRVTRFKVAQRKIDCGSHLSEEKKLTPGQSLVDLLRTLRLSRPVNELGGSRVHDNPYKKKLGKKHWETKLFWEKRTF